MALSTCPPCTFCCRTQCCKLPATAVVVVVAIVSGDGGESAKMAPATYKAYNIPEANASFQKVEKPLEQPPPGKVLIKVKACGICHSDSFTKYGAYPGMSLPRIPGHEIAGVIESVGEGVTVFKAGDRVGVGWLGEECGECRSCREGDSVCCTSLKVTGIHLDGGYGEYAIAKESALARIPDALSFEEAGPLMCAGVTVYNGLRQSKAVAGDIVVVQGIGGLGHLGVQFARAMGFHTIAVARGDSKKELALKLGAHRYLDSNKENKLGGARVIITTVTNAKAMSEILPALGVNGQCVIVGASMEPIEVSPIHLISGRRSIVGHPSGKATDSEDCLSFAALAGVKPMIEVFPLDKCEDAYNKMMSNEARFRVVLSIDPK
eukprot:jgi/Chlat1/8200/Chrsp76S07662